ncbi:MAG: hypothetical protein A2Z45_09310 [Chloroflexi bacterium RBG_19FT_COMBO_55_16]|nr:MAG: hypothetical protein A2Z45_09310 [Chloroflexi bacterium RBG_19FT_COMBO_55_16]
MNEQNDNSDIVEITDKDMNSQEVYSDPFADKVPLDADLIPETPMDGTVVHETPMEETIIHEMPIGETVVQETPMGETITHEVPIGTNAGVSASLLNREESEHFRTRWNEIQGKFVDEPRSAVQQADALVSEVIEQITKMFSNEHSSLEAQWKQGNDVSTEDLRKALQRYRSFFNRLVV